MVYMRQQHPDSTRERGNSSSARFTTCRSLSVSVTKVAVQFATERQWHFARQEMLDISGQGTDYSLTTKATESVGDSESEGSDLDFISDDGTSEVGSARGDLVEKSCSLEDGFVSGSGSEYDDLNFVTSQEDEENVTSQRLWGVDITAFLLRHLKNKVENGMSQEATMEGLRNLYELLKDERIPHDSWKPVIKCLKGLGNEDARVYKICFEKDHVTLMENKGCCVDC